MSMIPSKPSWWRHPLFHSWANRTYYSEDEEAAENRKKVQKTEYS